MTNNGKNMSTKIVVARFEENVGGTEVSCGKYWEHFVTLVTKSRITTWKKLIILKTQFIILISLI